MKRLLTTIIAFAAVLTTMSAQTKIMAHRGYYAHPGSFENTLTSLKGAQKLAVEAVELDVHLTTDDSLVILHGPKIAGTNYANVQQLDYKTVRSCVLPNGDRVPSLREYFTQAKKTTGLTLFLELKAHPTPERETLLAEKVIALCDEMNMYDQMVFISFSEHLCDEIVRLKKGALVMPISSSKTFSTQELLDRGFAGVSYHMSAVMNKTHLLDEAHEAGLQTVLWPVNSYDLADFAIRHNVDYVSSDQPQAMQNLMGAIRELKWKQTKKLIAFDLDGTLTQHKQPLSAANRAVLDTLATRYEIIMAGAGNCKRIYTQMGEYPITIVGNYGMEESRIVDGEFKIVRTEKADVDRKFMDKKCMELRKKYGYTSYKGDPLEYHESGMVTFGLLGTKPDAADKLAFDPDKIKRREMYPEVKEIFKDYSVFIGGTTSFDITPKQYNKYDAVMRYAAEKGYSKDEILFVGDDFADGGNDSQIRIYGMDYIRIDDYTRLPEKLHFLF
ncbi:MAG: HAD-IIB family hydrolase [Bacteroidales bacterium]|nr:HAD-IIB family hydrolase [Bacteroidales bacterium]